MPIKNNNFNKAKALLEKAGSKTAQKCHPAHTKSGDVPDRHGESLIAEADAENISADILEKARKIMKI